MRIFRKPVKPFAVGGVIGLDKLLSGTLFQLARHEIVSYFSPDQQFRVATALLRNAVVGVLVQCFYAATLGERLIYSAESKTPVKLEFRMRRLSGSRLNVLNHASCCSS